MESIYWPYCQLDFGKPWCFTCLFLWKKFWRETFERSCRLSASRYCLWSNGIGIIDRINSSLRLRIVIWRIECAANINSYLRQQRTFWWSQFFSLIKKKKQKQKQKKKKLSNRLTAAILKDLRLEIEQCSKYQLIFVTAKEVLSKPFLFWLKKIKKKRKLP